MGSVDQSTGGGGMGDLNPRGGGRGGRRGGRGGGGEVSRGTGGRSRGYGKPVEQYEKKGYNRNHGQQQPHNNGDNRNKDTPPNMMGDQYQFTPSPEELEFDDEQLALQEQIQMLKLQKEYSGKKNISLNHLLRFTLPQREAAQPVRRARKTSTPFKKETFLHANYRFIVSGEGGDFKDNITDPDKTVPWENVEQVYFHTDLDAEYHCPICLEKPVAAKVSRCGHVFCWACIMHHLSYTKGAGQCPLCFDWMLTKDLKSVVIEVTPKFSLKDDVSFSLLQRSTDANIPRLKSAAAHDVGILDSAHRLPVYTDTGAEFCRLTIAYDITSILAREWNELTEAARLAASAQDDSLPYIAHAQEALRERADKAHIPYTAISNRPSRGSRHRSNANSSSSNLNKATANINDEHSNAIPTETHSNFNTVHSEPNTAPNPTSSATHSTTACSTTPPPLSTITTVPPIITPTNTTTTNTILTNTTTNSTTSTPTLSSTNNENNIDMWGEDEKQTPPTTTLTPSSQSPTQMPSSSASSSSAQQVTFLHSSFDQSHIPPSVLSQSTTPTKTEDTSTATNTHHAQDNFTQETPHGLYYFYQVQDGQTVFLHPFCVRVLAHEYRAFDRLPSVLRGTIVDLEEVVQTEKTRRKFQYLSHLPLTCKFLLVYIDLTPLVSTRTLVFFGEDLKKIKQIQEKRVKLERQKHQEKEREEKQERERVQERARERQAEMDLLRESFTPLSSATASPPSSLQPPPSPLATSPPSGAESEKEKETQEAKEEEKQEDEEQEEGISFAQALMGAKPKPRRKPKPKANNNNNTSNVENPNNSGGGGRKKKKHTVVLFSNSGSRGYF